MKNLLLLIIFCWVFVVVHAQKKLLLSPYRPPTSKATIIEFLQDLNQQSGIVVEYSTSSFEANKMVQLKGDEATVGALLQTVLEGQRVKLLEHNNKIILVPSAEPFTIEHLLPARYSFFGFLKEEDSNEPLVSATVYEPAAQRGVVSNNQGYFNFLVPEGRHTIEISYGGLQPVTVELNIHGNVRRDISLPVKKDAHSVVVIEADGMAKDGAVRLTGDQSFASITLEDADPLQLTMLSLGTQNASAAFGGFQVREGGQDENLFLLDGNPVYNPMHMLGAISIINPTVLKALRLYKSDFPAKFSGSLSSVLDVYTKDGNIKSWHGEANAGLLAGAITLEGPLVKNNTTLMVSARKNISIPFYRSFQAGITSSFYDAHFKLTTILNSKNKLAVNLYKGEDQLRQGENELDNLNHWGNTVGSVSWNYVLGNRSFIHTSVNMSQYQSLGGFQYNLFKTDDDDDNDERVETKYIGIYAGIKHYNAKSQAEIFASKKVKFNIGVKLAQTAVNPFNSQVTEEMEDDEKSFSLPEALKFSELSSHAETEIKLRKNFFVKPGIHASTYQFKNYHTVALQPRFFMVYRIAPSHRIFASYSKMNQFLHLVTNPYPGVNKDIWVPSYKGLQPEVSKIYNVGYAYHYNKIWMFSVGGYYKQLANVTNFVEGKSILVSNNTWEQSVESGKGRSYGIEYMLKKNGECLSLQSAYALSWSWRQFNSINNGKEFPYKYDHRHAANIAASYALSSHLNISGMWAFASGNVYTLAGQVFVDSVQQASTSDDPLEDYEFTYHYSGTSQYRAKSFQRYDLALAYHSKKERRIYSALKAGVYNINGSEGQYAYTLRGAVSSKSIRVKINNSVFKIMPYLSYTLRF